ncbi:MAG: PTS sugar transporter subunit IIB [bacterium]|nr:PTS sugar transporter subunit IIB [bacterium]
MGLKLIRIDDRLIHGQVVVGWVRYLNANHIIVADDVVAKDAMQKALYEMVVPRELKVTILPVAEAAEKIKQNIFAKDNIILLLSRPKDVLELVNRGVAVKSINVGGMRFEPGKRQITKSVSVNDEDCAIFNELVAKGIEIEGRAVPTDEKTDIIQACKQAVNIT